MKAPLLNNSGSQFLSGCYPRVVVSHPWHLSGNVLDFVAGSFLDVKRGTSLRVKNALPPARAGTSLLEPWEPSLSKHAGTSLVKHASSHRLARCSRNLLDFSNLSPLIYSTVLALQLPALKKDT